MNCEMNERERLLAVLEGGQADRIPWYADLSWWHDAHRSRGDLPDVYKDSVESNPSYQSHFQLAPTAGTGYLRLHQDTGAGICFYAPMVWTEKYSTDIQIIVEQQENLITSRIITPVGELESTSQYLPESFTSAYKSYYVKKPEDLKVMQYIWTHREACPNYGEFERVNTLWNGAGIAFGLSPISTSAFQTLITRWAGIETTINLLLDAPELFEDTVNVLQSSDDDIFEIISNSPAQVVEFPDNISGQVSGKNFLRKYVLPYWIKRVKQLQQSGKYVGVHNDGGVKAALPIIIEAGFDFVEAVTPEPVGDITLDEIKQMAEGNIVVIGGVPGALFSPLYSREYFEQFIKDVLQVFSGKPGFALGVADQVPPDAKFERICLVRDVLENP
jgi:hypothetical protein